jgi:mannan endo-1,4-beta-mannosidase
MDTQAIDRLERTVFSVKKEPLTPSCSCSYVELSRKTADPHLIPEGRDLLARLHDAARQDSVLFGHQNAGHIGISLHAKDGTDSDVKRICGSHPAVVGMDTLSLLGYEGRMEQTIEVTKNLHREKVILTLSMHAPNFLSCDENFSGYSPNLKEPPVVDAILPGGAFNAKYLQYLDLICDYAARCVDDEGRPIPMIFRPFHENNGNWFWWGADSCSPEVYKELFRYTLWYIREQRGIHSLLYAYSPNGPFQSEEDYLSRYPGDDEIDVIGFDMYHDRPTIDDEWMLIFRDTCRMVASVARDRHKAAAVTETGLRMLDTAPDGREYEGLCPQGNPRIDWFSECLDTILSDTLAARVAYFLVWSNFSKTQFWVPYMTDDIHGHEMVDAFTRFLNRPEVVLADQL